MGGVRGRDVDGLALNRGSACRLPRLQLRLADLEHPVGGLWLRQQEGGERGVRSGAFVRCRVQKGFRSILGPVGGNSDDDQLER